MEDNPWVNFLIFKSQAYSLLLYVTIARKWKQFKCPSTNELVMKMWYMYTMEYYSIVKIQDIMNFLGKWMEVEKYSLSLEASSSKLSYIAHTFE